MSENTNRLQWQFLRDKAEGKIPLTMGWADYAYPKPIADCVGCDGYVLHAHEAPYCPTCARERAAAK